MGCLREYSDAITEAPEINQEWDYAENYDGDFYFEVVHNHSDGGESTAVMIPEQGIRQKCRWFCKNWSRLLCMLCR